MKSYQKVLFSAEEAGQLEISFTPNVFFMFVSPNFPKPESVVEQLKKAYPKAYFIGCSTAGEIVGNRLVDESMVLTAVQFEKSRLAQTCTVLDDHEMDSFRVGKYLSDQLNAPDLKHMFVLSDGLFINGAELVAGLTSEMDSSIGITGGLAADGQDFENTFVISNSGVHSKKVVALGIYGDALKVGFGSKGGWDSFGLERVVTKSDKNVLYELDGEPALDLYKSFLGDKASELPSSGLLFPLSLRDKNNQEPVVRTILGIDEEAKSLTFAGNIPEGSYVRLMKANIDRLINGAGQSASLIGENHNEDTQIAFLISCIGRRLVLKQFVEEELEAVSEILGEDVLYTGFYSYGEIAPFNSFSPCTLHNQTMTITTFSE
ncbi:FIST signal transduction protein [Allomuricauda sp. SCSIO 65647]|uniref:FIST signal transduction protein n=1 Tax=Allomuricauda sp. SCSIO 65647 TaxID=2908843 RepID=UPI001F295A85|nr:FIST N-terminal domain-containing protein [Muricauda sp. SCSIO 65647]UJH66416.1 FIST C-terminal domain-containing protein [Muricauda sp. SCSIO 65647]